MSPRNKKKNKRRRKARKARNAIQKKTDKLSESSSKRSAKPARHSGHARPAIAVPNHISNYDNISTPAVDRRTFILASAAALVFNPLRDSRSSSNVPIEPAPEATPTKKIIGPCKCEVRVNGVLLFEINIEGEMIPDHKSINMRSLSTMDIIERDSLPYRTKKVNLLCKEQADSA